jgi:hypothetical protein
MAPAAAKLIGRDGAHAMEDMASPSNTASAKTIPRRGVVGIGSLRMTTATPSRKRT